MNDKLLSCLRSPKIGFKILVHFLIASEKNVAFQRIGRTSLPIQFFFFLKIIQVMHRHYEQSIFQINIIRP